MTLATPTQHSLPNSPAADGKKEPSIKPAPIGLGLGTHFEKQTYSFDAELYPRLRGYGVANHANPQHAYTQFPLSGQGAVQLNDAGVAATAEVEEKPKLTDMVGYWLGLYFFFNLGLTLFNKVVLVSFPFPYVSLATISSRNLSLLALEQYD